MSIIIRDIMWHHVTSCDFSTAQQLGFAQASTDPHLLGACWWWQPSRTRGALADLGRSCCVRFDGFFQRFGMVRHFWYDIYVIYMLYICIYMLYMYIFQNHFILFVNQIMIFRIIRSILRCCGFAGWHCDGVVWKVSAGSGSASSQQGEALSTRHSRCCTWIKGKHT